MKNPRLLFFCVFWIALFGHSASLAVAQNSYLYGPQPGRPDVSIQENTIVLRNAMLTATWSSAEGKLRGVSFAGDSMPMPVPLPADVFALVLVDGSTLNASSMQIVQTPRVEDFQPDAQAAQLEEHFAGKRVTVGLEDPISKLAVTWSATLREGDNYVRQEISISSANDEPIREVRLFDFKLPSAQVIGKVKGSPVTAGNLFLGFEHPLSQCTVEQEQVRCSIKRELPLKAGATPRLFLRHRRCACRADAPRVSELCGTRARSSLPSFPALQLVVRHRLRESLRPGCGARCDQCDWRRVARQTRSETRFVFIRRWLGRSALALEFRFWISRRVHSDQSSHSAVWSESPASGFLPGADDKAKVQRMKYGVKQGFEMNKGGFALPARNILPAFAMSRLISFRNMESDQSKIDGTGNVNSVFPGSAFDSDFHAAISLIGEWRRVKPDIFVNLTTGTYPSPFWLEYADSIWRGGDDSNFAGVGSWRERWITYRDADTYAGM